LIRKWHGAVKIREERIKDGTLSAAARDFHLYTNDEKVMEFNRRLAGLSKIPEYIPQARERSQKKVEEMEELRTHQARRKERNDERWKSLVKGGDGVADEKYAGSEWDHPRSPPPKERRIERSGLREAIMGFDSDDEDGTAKSRWDGVGPPRPQYRPRRDSNEAVFGFGGDRDRFALVSKSGRHHTGKVLRGDVQREGGSVKGSRSNVVRFSEEVEVRVIDG
jgi:hypothetical protein